MEQNERNNPVQNKRDENDSKDLDFPKDNPYLKAKQKANETAKTSFDYAKMTSKNLDNNIRSNIKKVKESSAYHDLQEKISSLESELKLKQKELKRSSPRILAKIKQVILSAFEQIVGRIRIGTQYGKTSIDVLSDLAKLKELGIISEEEFNQKKKEILDRI